MDKATLKHEVANNLILLEEELRSFAANAGAKLWRKAVTNLYYAAYDATCALLWSKGVKTESHEGAQSMLSLHFVRAGALPKDTTKNLSMLMSLRHAADYKGDVSIAAQDVIDQRKWVVGFVNSALDIIRAEGPGASVSAALAALEQAERLVIAGAGGDTSPPPSRSKRRGTP